VRMRGEVRVVLVVCWSYRPPSEAIALQHPIPHAKVSILLLGGPQQSAVSW
jgi:hypothetical protein